MPRGRERKERPSWEGNGKLEGEGLSQEKTVQGRGAKGARRLETGKKESLLTRLGFNVGRGAHPSHSSMNKLSTRSGARDREGPISKEPSEMDPQA